MSECLVCKYWGGLHSNWMERSSFLFPAGVLEFCAFLLSALSLSAFPPLLAREKRALSALSGQLLSKTRMRNMPRYLLQRVTSLETEFSTFKYSFNAVIQNSRSQSWMNKNLEPKSSWATGIVLFLKQPFLISCLKHFSFPSVPLQQIFCM